MKRLSTIVVSLLCALAMHAQGWPENYGGVMLQGFYWDSYGETTWNKLKAQATDMKGYIDLIWVPNSGQVKEDQWNSAGNLGFETMGYMPVFWLKHNSCWGTETELKSMIQTLKANGIGVIEDVVLNHKNGLTNWADFPDESVTVGGKTYTLDWATEANDTWYNNIWGITKNDEVFTIDGGVHDGKNYICTPGAGYDEGDNFDGCRDLDHTNVTVQNNIKTYLEYLTNVLGYAGFRYDMVKGYSAYYVGQYNAHVNAQFSVGEYWDSKDAIKGWINDTGYYGGYTSAAFDFGLKYALNDAFNNSNWSALNEKGNAGDWTVHRYAVTFVENHDTYREGYNRVNNNVLAANAFILAMPGTPCLFWPHWVTYKNELKKMIKARKAAGVTNESEITWAGQVGGGYVTKVQGTKGSVMVISGYVSESDFNNTYGLGNLTNDYRLVSSGTVDNPNYAYFVSSNIELEPYPTVDYGTGTYYTSADVTLGSNTGTATIIYTTDGTTPSATNGIRVVGGTANLHFTETTTLTAGCLYGDEVVSISKWTYTVTANPLTRIYARSTDDKQMMFYTYDGATADINGSWGDDNKVTATQTIKGETWYYYDYDLVANPNLKIIFRTGDDNRYPAYGQPGLSVSDLASNNPYVILTGNAINTFSQEQLDKFGTYYWVSPEVTNDEMWESFRFTATKYRDDAHTVDVNHLTFALNDNALPSGTVHYYVKGYDTSGNVVKYTPYTDNYALGMTQTMWKYNNANGESYPTPYYETYDNCKDFGNDYQFVIDKSQLSDGMGDNVKSYFWILNTSNEGNVSSDTNDPEKSNLWYLDDAQIVDIPNAVYCYVKIPAEWSNVMVYSFGSGYSSSKWPGEQMTWVADVDNGANKIFKYQWTNGVPENIIFNNNNGKQTYDISFSNGMAYYIGDLNTSDNKYYHSNAPVLASGKWWGRPTGAQSLSIDLNRSIVGDASVSSANYINTDDDFYLFGNLNWNSTANKWEWVAQKADKYKFTKDETYADSLVYYIDVDNQGHEFKQMFFEVAPGTLFNQNSDVNTWSAANEWSKTIRMQAPNNRDQPALEGGLFVPLQKDMINRDQSSSPDIDTELYDKYRLYINLTSSMYKVQFQASPYLVGTAVNKPFGNGTTEADANTIALEWDPEKECYTYTGQFYESGEFRILANNSYEINWSEDSEKPGVSTTDGDYCNQLQYNKNSEAKYENNCGGNRVRFNLPTGTYTFRFYMGENGENSYYTISKEIPLRNITYISNSNGEKLGEIDVRTRTINGKEYKSVTSWADGNTYVKPANVDMYIVTGLEEGTNDGEVQYKVKLKQLNLNYIPANTGVLLMSTDAPTDATARNLTISTEGYKMAYAGYSGTDNWLVPVVRPSFIPNTITDNNNVSRRNFLFAYYRPKPYPAGETRGNYSYKLGFWRSNVSSNDYTHSSSANMAYLSLTPEQYGTMELGAYDTSTDPASAPYIHFELDENYVTGISEVTTEEPATTSDSYYTIDGKKMTQPTQRGIYINKDKKVIIK